MSSCFNFVFDELPLIILDNGVEAGWINGRIAVEYDCYGGWRLDDGVYVEGYSPESRVTYILSPDFLSDTIVKRLNGEWRDRVEDEVFRHIVEDHDEADADNQNRFIV